MSTATRHATRPAALFAEADAHIPNWQALGACKAEDPELFFPLGESTGARIQTDDAKAVCRRCPVMERCLQWALETRQDFGVWGGLSEQDRRRIHRRKKPVYRGGEQTAVDYILEHRLEEFLPLARSGKSTMQIAREMGTNVRTVNTVTDRLIEAGQLEEVKAA